MNRSWNAKFICSALVATLVLATWASVQAAPLVNLSLEGRKKGGDPTWLKTIPTANVGDVIQYRLLVQMAPVGTANTQRDSAGQPVTTTITSLNPTAPNADGMNSLYVALRQLASDGIQVNFTRGPIIPDPEGDIDTQKAILPTAWQQGTGAFGGSLENRGATGFKNLAAIRPVRASGNFAGVAASTVLVPPTANPDNIGEFVVMTNAGNGLATIMPMWGGSTSGGGRINGGTREIFVTDDTQANSTDPIVGSSPLVIGIPEPSTVVLAGMGVIGLVVFARRRNA